MNRNQRKDAETQGRKEEGRESSTPLRPGGFVLNESLIEDLASDQFIIIGTAIKRGVEIDDAGERSGPAKVALNGRRGTALKRLNPALPQDTVEDVLRILSLPPHPTLIENNRHFHGLLNDGVPVEYKDSKTGETRGGLARVIDFDNPANNDFLVVRQVTIAGPNGKTIRPDLILYVNGPPLVIRSPMRWQCMPTRRGEAISRSRNCRTRRSRR